MKNGKRKIATAAGALFLLVALVPAAAGAAAYHNAVRAAQSRKASAPASSAAAPAEEGILEKLRKAAELLEESDRSRAWEIASNRLGVQGMYEVYRLVQEGKMQSAKAYLKENLSEADIAVLQEIYDKYKNSVNIQNITETPQEPAAGHTSEPE